MINAHICTQDELIIAPFGRLLILTRPGSGPPPHATGKRGEVTTFSRESRKRLMQLFASLDTSVLCGNTQFVTLTYHRTWGESAATWHDDLRRFLQRLVREYGELAVIWRLEFQDRGAPHWHLLIPGTRSIQAGWCRVAWGEIAHQESEYKGQYSVDVALMDSVEKALVYVAKYTAKKDDRPRPAKTGRIWGVRRADLLPITLLRASIPRHAGQAVKEALIDMIGRAKLNKWVLGSNAGMWTMANPANTLPLLQTAVRGPLDWEDITAGERMPGALDKSAILDAIASKENT